MKTAIVVGAAGGVGMATARGLIEKGVRTLVTVRNEAEAAIVGEALPKAAGVKIVDLRDAQSTLKAIGALAAAEDRVDYVAVCAAIAPLGPIELAPLDVVGETLRVNVLSHVAIFQAVISKLRDSKGRLLFVSSMSGRIAMPFLGSYTASKYALEGVADVMRQEIAASGVNIILIEPGGIKTGMVSAQIDEAKRELAALSPELAQRYGHLYHGFIGAASQSYDSPLTKPDDVAAVILNALQTEKPATRYVVGADAEQLVGARAKMSDLEMDAMFADFFKPR